MAFGDVAVGVETASDGRETASNQAGDGRDNLGVESFINLLHGPSVEKEISDGEAAGDQENLDPDDRGRRY